VIFVGNKKGQHPASDQPAFSARKYMSVALLLSVTLVSGCWAHRVVATGQGRTAYIVSEHPTEAAVVLRCTAHRGGVDCVEVQMKASPRSLELPAAHPLDVAVAKIAPSITNKIVRNEATAPAGASNDTPKKKISTKKKSVPGGKTEVDIKRLKSPQGQTRALFTVVVPGSPEQVVMAARLPKGKWVEKAATQIPGKAQWTAMLVIPKTSTQPTRLEYFIRGVEEGKERFIGTKSSPNFKDDF
jgi:hypothetical protein